MRYTADQIREIAGASLSYGWMAPVRAVLYSAEKYGSADKEDVEAAFAQAGATADYNAAQSRIQNNIAKHELSKKQDYSESARDRTARENDFSGS